MTNNNSPIDRRTLCKAAFLASGNLAIGANAAGQNGELLKYGAPTSSNFFSQEVSLNKLAAKRGVIFGSAFDSAAIEDKNYGRLIQHHAGILTTDYQLKFGAIRKTEFEADFSRADRLIDFSKEAAIPVRGHTLVWNEWNPDWLNRQSERKIAYWLDRHIEEIVTRYKGKMHSWDVVNEPLWPGHNLPNGLRNGPWLRALGEKYIDRAFSLARQFDPDAKLVINEAWLERADHWGVGLRKAFLPLIDRLLDRGVKIDAVGLQSHLSPGNFAKDEFVKILHALRDRGLPVYITEMDVDDKSFADNIFERDLRVAEMYRDFLNLILAEPNVKIIQTWQLSDKYSFHQSSQSRGVRPLPFDKNMLGKAAYHAMAESFRNKPGF